MLSLLCFFYCNFVLFQNNQLNPIWNEHFEFIVEDAETQHLVVRIYDDEGVQSAEFIGCAHISLKELQPGKVKDVWLKLVKDLEIQRDTKYRGQVRKQILRKLLSSFLNFLIDELWCKLYGRSCCLYFWEVF